MNFEIVKETSAAKAARKARIEEYVQHIIDIEHVFDESMRNYFLKSTFDVLKLDNGRMIDIERDKLQREFCYMESDDFGRYDPERAEIAYKCEDAVQSDFNFFMKEQLKNSYNSRKIDQLTDFLKIQNESKYIYIYPEYCGSQKNSKICCLDYGYKFMDEDIFNYQRAMKLGGEDITAEQLQQYVDILKQAKQDLVNRSIRYWKRYGGKCLHVWTYYAD